MNEFKKMIEKDDIKVFDLIKGSIITVKQNFGKFMAAMFTFIGLSILVGFIFSLFATDIQTSQFMFYLNTFLTDMALFIVSSIIFAGVYYTILGCKEKAKEKTRTQYGKRAAILYLCVYLLRSLLFVLLVFVFTFYLILSNATIYINPITIILYILLYIVFIAFMMTLAGVRVEYLFTEQKISTSVKKAFGVASKNKGDLFKKAAGLLFWYGLSVLILTLLAYLAFVQFVGFEALDLVMFGVISMTTLATSSLIFTLCAMFLMLLGVLVGMMFNVSVTAYYLNLNRKAGNQIVGLGDTTTHVQEVKAVTSNDANAEGVEVVKTESVEEVEVANAEVANAEGVSAEVVETEIVEEANAEVVSAEVVETANAEGVSEVETANAKSVDEVKTEQ